MKILKFVLILIAVAAVLPLWVDLTWLGRGEFWSSPMLSMLNSNANGFVMNSAVFLGSLVARFLDPVMMALSGLITLAIVNLTTKKEVNYE